MKTKIFCIIFASLLLTGCEYVEYAGLDPDTPITPSEQGDTMVLKEPVVAFAGSAPDGAYTVLILFAKERLRDVTDTVIYFNGNVSNWEKKIIPASDKNYVIDNGQPKKVAKDGLYIGAKFVLKDKGLYNIALVHSGNNWTDLSGSRFIRHDNPGLVWFDFNNGEIASSGDQIATK